MEGQLKAWWDNWHGLVDLRSYSVFSNLHLVNSTNIPIGEFIDRMQELPERVCLVLIDY